MVTSDRSTPSNTSERADGRPPVLVQYWAGCPDAPNARWSRTLHEIRLCAEQGWRTYIVWSRRPEEPALWQPFTESGCQVVIHPRPRRSFDVACIWRTYRWLCSLECDVFHCHNQHTSPLIGAALAGVPVRLWSKLAMSQQYERGVEIGRMRRLMPSVRVSCVLAHRVLAVSHAVREELLHSGVAPAKVVVFPGAIDLKLYEGHSADPLLAELGLDSEHTIITTVGHAVPVKGWDILLHAFARIAESVPLARLVLVGSIDGPHERDTYRALCALADDLNVADRVRFAGRRADIPSVLSASDIFVLPSRSEGHPNALKEAMAAGLPCIASRVGGIAELLSPESGLMFEREDHSSLAIVLRDLIENEALRHRLGENARKVASTFAVEPATRRLLRLYGTLLAQH